MLAPCVGRARLSSDVSEIKLVFSIPPHRPTPNIAPVGTSRLPTRFLLLGAPTTELAAESPDKVLLEKSAANVLPSLRHSRLTSLAAPDAVVHRKAGGHAFPAVVARLALLCVGAVAFGALEQRSRSCDVSLSSGAAGCDERYN